jgi:uncharacterized protein YdeI (YjbR/CyaY-like superfamily)
LWLNDKLGSSSGLTLHEAYSHIEGDAKTTKRRTPVKMVHVINRDDWRDWLQKNHNSEKEVWLVHYKRRTGKATIPYDDAVEEALCFGWIDSTIRKLDEEKYAQRYTPRRRHSKWSKLNVARARKMVERGRMTKAGLVRFSEAKKDHKGTGERVATRTLTLPPALKEALVSNKNAWENFSDFAPSYRRLYIGWVMDAKREETRKKRIEQVVKWAAKKKKPGMM